MLPPTPPPHFDIPAFDYRPEFGSHGTGPLVSSAGSVSATSQLGGYPDVDNPNCGLTGLQHHITLRLTTLIWASEDARPIRSILGGRLSLKSKGRLSELLRVRFCAHATNPMYHMVQENVESYDLGVNIRNLARTSVLYGLMAFPGESQAATNRRHEIAAEYQSACYELRDRAIAHIDKHIADLATSCEGIAGLVQITRLESLRARFEANPFENLDVLVLEVPYSRLTRNGKRKFWLARYDENIVAWYWDYRDLIDIRATIAEEPMATYSREEFAHVCDAMRTVVIGKKNAAQAAMWHNASYRKACGFFNARYNRGCVAGLVVYGDPVRSLAFIKVRPWSFSGRNDCLAGVTRDYTVAVEMKYLAEHGEGGF
jgi:hypothetical protein